MRRRRRRRRRRGGEEELLDWHKVGRCGLEMFAVRGRKTERRMEGEGRKERGRKGKVWRGVGGMKSIRNSETLRIY